MVLKRTCPLGSFIDILLIPLLLLFKSVFNDKLILHSFFFGKIHITCLCKTQTHNFQGHHLKHCFIEKQNQNEKDQNKLKQKNYRSEMTLPYFSHELLTATKNYHSLTSTADLYFFFSQTVKLPQQYEKHLTPAETM